VARLQRVHHAVPGERDRARQRPPPHRRRAPRGRDRGRRGAFSTVHRGATGDARGSSQNDLAAEFLGDYVYAAATRTYGTGVWNDMRRGAHCDAVDRYRQALHDEAVVTGQQTAEAEEPRGESAGEAEAEDPGAPQPPDVQSVCPAAFGNSDIYGGSWAYP
jgi:hypothetical protein